MNQELRIKKKNVKCQKGFTLVELLAAIVVVVAVGTVISGIVTSSLRGTNKTNITESIRQNGNYAITRISKDIEYAQAFNGLSRDNSTYTTSCPYSVDPTPSPITTPYAYLKLTSVDNKSVVYMCDNSTPATFKLNNDSLIDTNSISVKSCAITCIQKNLTDVPIIRISLTLGPKNPSNLLEGSTPDILFETSVTIRNYRK